ncbi:MAG TPA: hypothetical protein VKY33_08085 [Flavobacterium sp.]|nr:hypothetical protein [Flavobacterium sp.]
MISYLQFLLKSNNQHGVHSPFVFNYLTKGLYVCKKSYSSERNLSVRLILSTIAYFDFKKIEVKNETLQQKIQNHFPQTSVNTTQQPFDLIITDNVESVGLHQKQMHNNSLLILHNISGRQRKIFHKISGFTLVLDFYHTIIFSVRREQLPQTFYLRY